MYLRANKEYYKLFIEDDEDIDKYIRWIARDGKWGGQLEMNVLAHVHQFNLIVLQVGKPKLEQAFFPWSSVPCLFLSYHGQCHYKSVRLLKDPCIRG
jgi:hypothetical protein